MSESLSIIEIDVEHVGQPRSDGNPGSALYRVPIKLSREPTAREAQFLVHHWDNPTSWSTMHRPGIAHVSGDCLVLDGTTVEEVRDHHTGMLKRVVAATNASEAEAVEADRVERETLAARRAAHEANVKDVAAEIRFD